MALKQLKIPDKDTQIDNDEDYLDFFSKEPYQKLLDILKSQNIDVNQPFGHDRFKFNVNLDLVFKEIIKNPFSYSLESFD